MVFETISCAHCGSERFWKVPPAVAARKRVVCFGGASPKVQAVHVVQRLWEAYQKVLPDEQHEATGKGDGQTCHIEGFNNILRQWLGRFVRKTLSFSECDQMHELCLRLFLHEHNKHCSR